MARARTGIGRKPRVGMAGHTLETSNYWNKPVEDLLGVLEASRDGLTSSEAERRLVQFGPNALEFEKKATLLRSISGQFRNAIMLILLFATGVSAVLHDWVDAVIILAIVMGSAVLSALQEYKAGTAVERLRERIKGRVSCLRDGKPLSVPADEVVPGDMVLLSAGVLVPADGVLLEATDLYVNQAVLTGESFPVEKTPGPARVDASLAERTNCVFLGTNVRSGSGRCLVVETGPSTAFGQVAERLVLREPETEFEHGIRRFGYLLTEVMLILVIIVFAVNVFAHRPVIEALLFSVALAVGITPQLLPAIVSITLSKGAQVMAAQGVIVRRLESIENFGSMDVLCSDKTGTLTEGVVSLDSALDSEGRPSDRVLRYAYINSTLQSGLVNPLDTAIVGRADMDITAITKIAEIPYDFVRKRLSVVVEDRSTTPRSSPLLITKGALEGVLAVCSHVRVSGALQPLDDPHRTRILERFATWSGQGYRVLGLAVIGLTSKAGYTRLDEASMVFEGFLLFFDPPKQDVKQAITDLLEMGVRLKIISGDNRHVSRHVAESVGVRAEPIVSGADLDELRDEALWHTVDHTDLFVEVDPNQKERLILALKKTGHVVGYMGDGINDAPALHAADVGISVEGAVDVAKEAADFVLLRRDLSILRRGIALGRKAFANTLKYVFMTTSANFGNMFSMAGASLFLPFLPMLPMQILLTNFLTDFPALTISSDNVDPDLVLKPRRWDIGFIRRFMVSFGILSSLFDYLTFGILLLVFHTGMDQFRTDWFFVSVMTELLIILVLRTRRPFFRSRPGRQLVIAVMGVVAVTFALPYTPLGSLLKLTHLPAPVLLLLTGITVAYVLANEVAKKVFYRTVGR
jgi:Mg2+-importing ATPase